MRRIISTLMLCLCAVVCLYAQEKFIFEGSVDSDIADSCFNVYIGDEYFHIEGDTALFSFDSFVADEQAWRDYYENGGELPDDTVGDFKRALDAAADANVKNFVVLKKKVEEKLIIIVKKPLYMKEIIYVIYQKDNINVTLNVLF